MARGSIYDCLEMRPSGCWMDDHQSACARRLSSAIGSSSTHAGPSSSQHATENGVGLVTDEDTDHEFDLETEDGLLVALAAGLDEA